MLFTPDLAVYNRSGRLTAIAEVRNKLGTSREWAAQTRRNLLVHDPEFTADFFLFVMPDRLYVWKGAGAEPVKAPPTYEADAGPALAPYFESARVDPRYISRDGFDLLVGSWLSDVARSTDPAGEFSDGQDWLAKSGFRSAVKGGRVKYDAVM